jgi:Dolichyl-phosphate-mannose-protein mannosyltransferase
MDSEVLAWFDRHRPGLLLVGGLLLVAAVVLGAGATRFPAFSDDEGTYVAQAWAVLAEGSLAHYTYWYDHPPLGWLQLAVVGWFLDPILSGPAVVEGRRLMLVPALVSCGLLYMLARRLGLNRGFAAAAVALFALSPLSVSFLRMVYLDNIALPWILAAFVLAVSPRARLWAYAASGACFAIAVLSKETSLLLLPALVLQVWQGLDRRTRSFCLTAFGCVLCLLLLGYPIYALLKGELFPGPDHVSLLEAVQFQLYGRASTGSALQADSVSRELVDSWLALDAWLPALGLAAAPFALAIKRLRPVGVAVIVLAVVAMKPGYLPQPYVIALLPFLALAAAGTLDAASRFAAERSGARRLPRAAVPSALVILILLMAPSWLRADRFAAQADQTSNVIKAQNWIRSEVHPRARVLVDDTMYVDLVRAGFEPRFGAVWFYKLDFTTNLDPSIAANLPQGWRAFDYVVSTRVIRSALARNRGRLRQVRLALSNSRPLATFGTGPDRVEVRRITGVGTGSGLIPRKDPDDRPARVPAGLWPSLGGPLPPSGGRSSTAPRRSSTAPRRSSTAPRRPAAEQRRSRGRRPTTTQRRRPVRSGRSTRRRRAVPLRRSEVRQRRRATVHRRRAGRSRRSSAPRRRAAARGGPPAAGGRAAPRRRAQSPVRPPSRLPEPRAVRPQPLDGVRGIGGRTDLDPHGDLMTLGGRR